MSEFKKRGRSSNFEKQEILLLTELVTKFRSIIENKKTDAVTNKEKETVWSIITNTFNAALSGPTERTAKTLKLKYEAIKKGTKKKMTFHRQELYKTGGGLSAAPKLDEVEEKVLAICSNISGLEARNDSDNFSGIADKIVPAAIPSSDEAIPRHNTEIEGAKLETSDILLSTMPAVKDKARLLQDTTLLNGKDMQIEEMIDGTDDFCRNQTDLNSWMYTDTSMDLNDGTKHQEIQKDSQNNWSTWNPRALKTKMSQALKPTKASVTSKLDQLSAARLELVQLQRDIAEKEHLFVQKEHQLKMQNLQNEEKRQQELHELMLVARQRQSLN